MNALFTLALTALSLTLSVHASGTANTNENAIIPLSTALTENQKHIVEAGCREPDFEHPGRSPQKFYNNHPTLRLHAVNHAWQTTRNKDHVFFSYFGDLYLFRPANMDVISFFTNPEIDFVFNIYASSYSKYFISYDFYDGSKYEFNYGKMTILQIAVLMNNPKLVEYILSLNLATKLQIDKPMADRPHVTARSIARKIKDESKRSTMLKLLQIDRTKHDMSRINNAMKDDLEITVKEAVIANNIAMFESALLLGNHGDKNDESIIKYAVNNGNFLILEALVMEGYAIPDLVISDYKGMNKEDVDFILKNKELSARVPYKKRKGFWNWDYYNEQCF